MIRETLLEAAGYGKNLLKQKWLEADKKAKQEAAEGFLNQQLQYASFTQYSLQDSLGLLLQGVAVSKLVVTVSSKYDLVPDDHYWINNNGQTVYQFFLAKHSNDSIAVPVLQTITDKINKLIISEIRRMQLLFMQLNREGKAVLAENYPALYNGYHVEACIDAGNDIIIQVVYN